MPPHRFTHVVWINHSPIEPRTRCFAKIEFVDAATVLLLLLLLFLTFISCCKSVSLWISTNYLHHLTAIYGQWNDLIWSACSECEAIDSMLEANARTRLFMLCVNAVPVISFDFVLNFPHVKFFHDSLQWNKFKLNWLAYRSLWMNQISIYRRSQLSKWFYK